MSYNDDTYGHLNCSIMNYYKRFGQNRDLERYLRLQRSYGNCNKSSSEGSLYHPATSTMNENAFSGIGGGIGSCDDNMGRSLQNLSVLKNTSASSSRDKLNMSKFSTDSKKSNEFLSDTDDRSVGAGEEISKTPVNEDKSIVAKENITKSKKGVNINFESFIEINMPNQQLGGGDDTKTQFACHPTIPTPIMPPPPATIVNIQRDVLAPHILVTSSEKMSQTQQDKGSQIETPIVPTTTSKTPMNQSFQEDTQPNYSPTSSIASQHKQKLEWDSGADVGYSKKLEPNVENGLSAIERNALIKLFANYGLNFDSNIILFSTSKSGAKSEENVSSTQPHRKEVQQKWQNICKKLLEETKRSAKSTIAHSTPIEERKSSIKNTEGIKLIDQISRIEKFCQTSNTELKSFGVQVSAERTRSETDAESIKSSPSIDNKSVGKYENEGKSNDHSSSESFNFVAGAEYLKLQESKCVDPKKRKSATSSLDDMTLKSISSSSNFDVSKLNDNPCYKKLSKLEKNLTVGINLMNSLLQSKSLSTESKNSLIKKIITKLEKIIQKNCGGSNKILEFYQNQLKEIKNKHPSQENVVVETPSPAAEVSKKSTVPESKPSTKSGITVASSADVPEFKKPSKSKSKNVSPTKSRTITSSASTSSRKSEWLEPMTHSELNYELLRQKKQMIEISNGAKLQADQTEESKQLQLAVIEANMKYLEKLKIYLKSGEKKENQNFNIEPPKNIENEARIPSALSWNSHSNLKESYSNKKLSNRSKLETPRHIDSNESINTFARHKKEEFIEKYQHRIVSENPESIKVIYTKPYSKPPMGEYYSNPTGNRNTKLSSNNSTSIVSSNVFLTSDNASTSLSIAKSSSKSTPVSLKFQENILNIGTQTSDSLRMTEPFFDSKRSTERKTTRIIKRMTNNKGNQMTPRSIRYTITFNDGRQLMEQYGPASSNTDEYYYEKPVGGGGPVQAAPKVGEFISNSNIPSRCSSINDIHNYVFSLQSHLNEKRPDFMVSAEERRKYIQDVNEKRRYRNTEREKILNATTNHNQSINTKLTQLPKTRPPPNNRLFSSKQIKMQTKRKYTTLPEVVQRKELLKENQLRKNNKRIMELFNKNLQKQVLKGKVTLSNSLVLV